MERYNFKEIEQKWQEKWDTEKSFLSKLNKNKKKFYCLEMFPYPSGKIHITEITQLVMLDTNFKNYNVLHPMGWDSFGMPQKMLPAK